MGTGFSFIVVACVGFVSVVGSFEVVVVTVVFEDGYEIFEAETLLIVSVVVKVSVSNHVVKDAGLRWINVMISLWIIRVLYGSL